jgi:hypothetical protein
MSGDDSCEGFEDMLPRQTNDVPSLQKDLERFLICGTDLASESSWSVNRDSQ